MRDLIVSSCIAGTVAFLYKTITNHVLYYLGITSFLYRVEAATLVLPINETNTFGGAIIGLFTDLILVVWFALLTAYILNTTGWDYALLKGAFVGGSAWIVMYGFFEHIEILPFHKATNIESGLTSIFFDVTMGIVISYTLLYLKRVNKF